jgi:hypothetical protein
MGAYHPWVARKTNDHRPRERTDAAKDIARELADVAGQLAHLRGEAMNWLDDPNYAALRLRIENAHAAVEAATGKARRRLRLNEGDAKRGRESTG